MEKVLKKVCRGIMMVLFYIYYKIVYRMRTIGKENIPKTGAIIFCGNHRSYADPPIIVLTAGRKMSFMAKEELKKNPFIRFLVYIFEAIWVKRDSKDIAPLKSALKILKNGDCIGIFPEGTRNGIEKNNGEIKNGAAYMALKTGAQLLPLGIVGTFKPFSKNAIVYGKPIDLSKYADKKIGKSEEEEVSELLKCEILRLAETKI